MSSKKEQLVKRDWWYLQPPEAFEIAPCKCGNSKTQWSEFKEHLWCDKCEIDFIPEHGGIFDGPIPVKCAELFGLRFDRFNAKTNKVERFNSDTNEYKPEAAA